MTFAILIHTMQIKIAFTSPFSEYQKIIEDLFETKLNNPGDLIYDISHKLHEGVIFSNPKRTIKESLEAPQTIVFIIDVAKNLAIGTASGIMGAILYNKLQNCSWLKIGEKSSDITLENIRQIIREELGKQKDNSD